MTQRLRRRAAAWLAIFASGVCVAQHKDAAMHTTQPARRPANRLQRATSPYLQQHAHNPVDWFEWNAEALARAKAENKPIFLSIGYSACHWCHVMAHECFESDEIAAVMNRLFVNIKVDREERPDIDELYMQATMIMNEGQGGWPMSVWLTPDGKPFFAGTYFPPESKWGRPGFRQICERIGELWAQKREALLSDAERLTDAVRQSLAVTAESAQDYPADLTDRVAQALAGAFDGQRGGLLSGATNKFPPSMALDLMLRAASRRAADDPQRRRMLELVELTLDRMAAGGIYDQLGGGIHRYSTDADWLVPHFEKMLYDQAMVSRAYVEAFVFTRKPLYARVAREIFDYVIADLQSPEGGLYSTRDADSDGEEGRYFVWTRQQVLEVLGPDDGEIACAYYDVSDAGNWRDPHAPGVPKNVLHTPRDLPTVASMLKRDPAELEQRLRDIRRRLLDARGKRVAPHRDEKILCEWNGLMIASLARGGAAFGEPRYVDAAARAARFVLDKQCRDGRLLRSYRDGRTLEAAFLADYAAMIDGLIELYEATFERVWLDRAAELSATAIRLFADDASGGFFSTSSDHETLIARTKDLRDSAVPSGNSLMLGNLLRLSVMLGDESLRKRADAMMSALSNSVLQMPLASERFLAGVDFAANPPVEVAIVGDPRDARTHVLVNVVRGTYLPNRVVMLLDPANPSAAPTTPLLASRTMLDNQPTAYVCRNYACQRPVNRPEDLQRQLRQ